MTKYIQLMPAGRWVALCRDAEDIDTRHIPLLAWALTDEGDVVPLYAGSDGAVHDPRNRTDFQRIARSVGSVIDVGDDA